MSECQNRSSREGELLVECDEEHFRIGLPKGRLLGRSVAVAESLGLRFGDRLTSVSDRLALRAFLLKAQDIARLVACDELDCGFVPDEWLREHFCSSACAASLVCVAKMRWTRRDLCFFGSAEARWPPVGGSRVATSFPGIAVDIANREWGIRLEPLELRGSVEAAVPILAEYGLDLVETGSTLRSNALTLLQPVYTALPVSLVCTKRVCTFVGKVVWEYVCRADAAGSDFAAETV